MANDTPSLSSQAPTRPKIEYVLFDMDGLMLDTEIVYTIATNKILAEFGKEMTWDIKAGCMGKPERAAAEHLLSYFPGIPLTIEHYLTQRTALQDALWPTVGVLPGVHRLVAHLHAHGVPMAVATGSQRRNFELKTARHAGLFALFGGRVVCGDDAGLAVRGKPAPDIFLVAARELLGVDVGRAEEPPTEVQRERRGGGLVFEDALPGMQAGKRAGMNVVWVPDPQLEQVHYDGEEKPDQVLQSLEDFRPEEWGLPPYPIAPHES